jgi:dihydroorotate dehydrogenase
MNFYPLIKKTLFHFDPETAHDFSLKMMASHPFIGDVMGREASSNDYSLKVGNNRWMFPVGLAAGLDKNGACIDFLSRLGFGAVEVGTVTPKPQIGNEKPRLWRYPQEASLRNRMGFNNSGAQSFANNISTYHGNTPVGVNIGKNKVTPDDMAYSDYQSLYEKFKNDCDYIVINVSSPNTPGLREHQSKEGLENILKHISREEGDCDLYVKIAPDINEGSISDVVELVKKYDLTGLVATNTTIMEDRGPGGVSGKLLYEKARTIRMKCLEHLKETPEIEFIGVGGFSNFAQLLEYWRSGGKAVQVYSSFIFQGPQLLQDVQDGLDIFFKKYQVSNFEDFLHAVMEK